MKVQVHRAFRSYTFLSPKSNKKADSLCMKFLQPLMQMCESASIFHFKIHVPFFVAPSFSKIFSTPRISKMVNKHPSPQECIFSYFYEPLEVSVSLLNICWIFSQISQICNSTMIGRNSQFFFVQTAGKCNCESRN